MIQCFKCGASVLGDDKFCEECGQLLSVKGCQKCGAGIESIDAQGYCSSCGFRHITKEREHLEVIINRNFAGVSDRGIRHDQNEDFLALQPVNGNQTSILVVCDGVSSSEQPEVASKIVAESICQSLASRKLGDHPDSAMKLAFATAYTSVCKIALEKVGNSEPSSTTVVAAIVENGVATIGWLGDSRAYWISEHSYQQLTTDHSWLTEVVAAGEMTATEAGKSPYAHAITRWVGADAADTAAPDIVTFTIPGAGYLLLCTDGLWNYTPQPQKLANLVQKSSNAEAVNIARTLVEFALHCGGHDNITVAVLICG